MLPALIEVFVNSALVPASNRASPDGQTVNEPISEHEIRVVFQNPVFDLPCKTSGQTPIRGHRSRESTPFKSKTFLFYLYESLRKWVLALGTLFQFITACKNVVFYRNCKLFCPLCKRHLFFRKIIEYVGSFLPSFHKRKVSHC